MATEVPQEGLQLVVVPLADEFGHVSGVLTCARQPLSQRGGVNPEQSLIHLVRHAVDAVTKQISPRQLIGRLEFLPIFGVNHVPAVGVEHLSPDICPDTWDNPVEALAIEVDDPQGILKAFQGGVGYAFPDYPLVKFGVSDEADKATTDATVLVEVVAHVLLGQPCEVGCNSPNSDRARREVDAVRVLGSAGVGLQPVELPECGQILGI